MPTGLYGSVLGDEGTKEAQGELTPNPVKVVLEDAPRESAVALAIGSPETAQAVTAAAVSDAGHGKVNFFAVHSEFILKYQFRLTKRKKMLVSPAHLIWGKIK